MGKDDVDIRVRLRGQRETLAGTKKVAGGIKGIGTEAKRAGGHVGGTTRKLGMMGRAAGTARRPFSHLSGEAKGLAKNLLAVGVGYASVAGIKKAVDTTVDLGKATLALNRNLDDVGLSSGLASVFKQRGVDVKAANMSLTKLATTQDKARHGDEKSLATLKRLGISQQEVNADGNDLGATLFKVADGLGSLERGNKRTALAQQLFGKGAQKIVPLLDDGSASLKEQMRLADEYGATLSGKNVDQIKEYISHKREMDFAEMGWQITMGTLVLPTLTKAVKGFAKLSKEFRDGTGTGGEIRDTMREVWHSTEPTVKTIGKLAAGTAKFAREHPTITKAAIALLFVGRAVNTIKTAKAVAGLSSLVGLSRRVGRRSGAAYATSLAQGITLHTGPALEKTKPGMKGTFAKFGKWGGRTAGAVVGVAIAAAVVDELKNGGGLTSAVKKLLFPAAPGSEGSAAHGGFYKDALGQTWKPGTGPGAGKYPKGFTPLPGGRPPPRPRGPRNVIGGPKPRAVAAPRIVPRAAPVFSGGDVTVVSPVYLDGRVITEVVAHHTRNHKNRR